jgi:amino acid adenylation domain-containing protein/non-ribosomal peptide synthase protein (TIGR01720 family)
MQQGMLFHSLSRPQSGVDIEQLVCRLPEAIDGGVLQQAWEAVAARHSVLRTRFAWEGDGEPLQIVRREVRLPMAEEDWSHLPAAEQEARLVAYRQADRERGFDLAQAPLMRWALFRLSAAECLVVWTFHHAILDGRSFPILLKELFALYEAMRAGRSLSLEPPRPYQHYIEWLQQQDFSRGEPFWCELLKGFSAPTGVLIPAPESRADPEQSYGEAGLRLSAALTAGLCALADQHQVTLNTLVQGGWALLLSRNSGEEEVVFGATRACRRSTIEGAPSMVGVFINTLPVRVRVSGDLGLGPWLRELRSQHLAVRECEHTPLAMVQAWSEVPSGTPLFESIVVFENLSLDAHLRAQGGAWERRTFRLFEQSGYPLAVTAYADPELLLRISYDRSRFEGAAVERMLGHLETLLAGMVAEPEERLARLPMLTEAERQQILGEWSGTSRQADREATIHRLFEAQVERDPEAVAVIGGSRGVTYRELDDRSNQLAHYLRERGVGAESRVGLCLERSVEMVVALLAILKAGGAYVPLDPGYPAERLEFMLADAGVSVVIARSSLRGLFTTHSRNLVCRDEEESGIQSRPTSRLAGPSSAEQLAYVIYTSGSTGTPKGVGVPHRGVVRLVRGADYARLSADEVFLQLAPLTFDASTFEIWGALLNGARLVLYPPQAPDLGTLGEIIRQHGVTTLWLTAGLFHAMVEHQVGELEGLRQLLAGGDILSAPHVERALRALPGCRLINGYGPTENTTFSCCYSFTCPEPSGSVPIGRPIAGSQAFILNHRLQPVPVGVEGELYVGGEGLARGYVDRPELTAEKFIPHSFSDAPGARLYRTGDLARYREDGIIEFLGRRDQQVKVRGFRVEPGEIEAALEAHPGIRQSAVVARSDGAEDHGSAEKRLVAYVVPVVEPAPGSAELRLYLQARLPAYMLPAAFVTLDALPLTRNGKLDRRALPAPDLARPEREQRFVAPRTPVEGVLAEIWAKVLQVERVGVQDNFFELGGDSILSLQIIAGARQAGVELTPRHVFRHQTIAELAAVAGVARPAAAEPGRVTGPTPLTPIEHWFFEQELIDPHHFNQAILMDVDARVAPSLWEQSIRQTCAHHDALRLRFERGSDEWRQFYADGAEVVSFAHIELEARTPEVQQAAIELIAVEVQASLDLSAGPLARAVHFGRGAERPAQLLLVLHHLVVDGVSWRILLEDLQRAIRALVANGSRSDFGEAETLRSKTSSYQEWSRRLMDHARSGDLLGEMDYWLSESGAGVWPLPQDYAEGLNSVGSERTARVSLSVEETEDLLHRALAAHNTLINELLLAALSVAMAGWTEAPRLRVDVEGHGREAIFDDVDLSRTVGWFTSIYPVELDLRASRTPGEALRSVREWRRRLPNRGIGYGLLRYLARDSEIARRMRSLPKSEVSFNYLGQFDQLFSDPTLIGGAWEWCTGARSPRQIRSHLLSIDGQIADGRLEMVWSYSEQIHQRSTIERLADAFMDALRSMIVANPAPESLLEMMVEFPELRLDAEKLAMVLDELDLDSTPAD